MSIIELPTAPAAVSDPSPLPTVKDVRSNFSEENRKKSTLKGVTIFTIPAIVYVVSFVGLTRSSGWVPKICWAAMVGGCIDMLFLIGHDACHQSLTPNAWINRIIGRLAFLPSLHPYSLWDHGHNSLHHGWTNCRGHDPTFVPYSKADYDRLSPTRQWMERFYRTAIGVGAYYLIEMWGKFGAFPKPHLTPKVKRPIHTFDRLLVLSFFLLEVVVLIVFGRAETLGFHSRILADVVLLTGGIVLPYLFWNWCMGFVIYLHHTHPEVPWFGDKEQWTFFAGQVGCVVHIELPRPIELFLHNILDHTAHHVDPKIPLYNLPDAQRRLEDAYPEQIKVVPFTLGGFRRTLKTCRLYDYEQHRWLDYDGTPLSEPIRFRGKPSEVGSG